MGRISKLSTTVPRARIIVKIIVKLDRVGPVDTRPSTYWLHDFVRKKSRIQETPNLSNNADRSTNTERSTLTVQKFDNCYINKKQKFDWEILYFQIKHYTNYNTLYYTTLH